MKLSVLSLIAILLSCSPQYHIERADKHVKKAIKRGAKIDIKIDTLIINDTITETFTYNDTTFVTNTITRYVTSQGELRYITKVDKRKEYRLEKRIQSDSSKLIRLQTRLDAKNERVAVKSNNKVKKVALRSNRKGWIWLLIGIALGIIIDRKFFK